MFGFIAFSQARLGSTVSDIKSEFWESRYKLKSGYDKDGDYYINIETERANVLYYFDSDIICTSTVIAPYNQGALNFYVEIITNSMLLFLQQSGKCILKMVLQILN